MESFSQYLKHNIAGARKRDFGSSTERARGGCEILAEVTSKNKKIYEFGRKK